MMPPMAAWQHKHREDAVQQRQAPKRNRPGLVTHRYGIEDDKQRVKIDDFSNPFPDFPGGRSQNSAVVASGSQPPVAVLTRQL